MSCENREEEIFAYADGGLRPADRVALVAHINECSGCRSELLETERLKAATSEAASERMPGALRARISGMIESAEPMTAPLRPRLFAPGGAFPRWALAGAAAAGLLIYASSRVEEPPRPTVSAKMLLSEHMRSTRKSVDVRRGTLAAAPYAQPDWSKEIP